MSAHQARIYASPGMKLFRFMNSEADHFQTSLEHLLCNNEVFLSSRQDFNDPFDMNPILKSDWTIGGIRRHVLNVARNPMMSSAPDETIAQYFRGPKQAKIPSTALRSIKEKFPHYMKRLLDGVGVCCFTEEMQNPIFWAHYAGNYSGICIQFSAAVDTNHPFHNCMKVHYAEHRPTIRATQTGAMSTVYDSPNWAHIAQFGFCTKSIGWVDEKEWRLWLPDRARTYQALPSKTLKAIFLGPFATRQTVALVRSLVEKASSQIRVCSTQLSASEFSVEVATRIC